MHHLFLVEFVGDFAHDFFQHIFQCDESTGPAVLVHHDGHVDLLGLEFAKEVVDFFALRDVHRAAQHRRPIEVVLVKGGQQIFHVEDAHDLVCRSFVNRNATEARSHDGGPNVRPGVFLAKSADVHPRGHHLFGVLGSEVDNALQNALLVFGALGVVGQFQGLFKVFHTQFPGRRLELVVHPSSHAHEWQPSGPQHSLEDAQGYCGEFGQPHPKRGRINLGNDFAEEHQQEGDAHHVDERVDPRRQGVAWKQVLRNHCGDEHDGDVHEVVHHQNGPQQVAWPLCGVGGSHEVENALCARRFLLFEVAERLGRQTENRHL